MAYPSRPVGSTNSRFQPHPVTPSGLLSPETWQEPEHIFKTRTVGKIRNQPAFFSSFDRWSDSDNDLPDEVLFHFSDLDNDSRNFLKHGPRSAAEKLAYAQEVHPLAHLDAEPASREIQRKFEEYGNFDRSGYFVGPDGRVYLRNEDSEERPGAKVRRGFEKVIGGFATPDVHESLSQISEATRSKRADVELYNPPTLPEQEDRERLLAAYHINPKAWQSGRRAPEEDQKTFRDGGYVWDAIYPLAYAGPDGVLYYKNELTQRDPLSAYNDARDWVETQEYLHTLPDPTADELMFRAMAAGGMMPGGRQVRFANNSSGKFIAPGSLEARAAIRARLADIPRQAALHGWKQAPDPAANPQAPHPIADPLAPQPTVNPRISKKRFWRKYSWGRRGNPKTKDDLERDFAARIRGEHWEQTRGSRNEKREEVREEYLPNYFGWRRGSTYPDVTFKAKKNPFPDQKDFYQRVEQGDVDPNTLRATLADHDKTLRNFKKYRGNWLLGVKHHQLEEAIRRKKEEERDDEYFWPEE